MDHDYYVILEIAPTDDLATIKASYRRLAKKYHPDVNSSPDAQHQMKVLNLAYQVLSDPGKRKWYDSKRGHVSSTSSKTRTTASGATGQQATSEARPNASHEKRNDGARASSAPPKSKRKTQKEEIRITEDQISEAMGLKKINIILTTALLQRRLGIDYLHAARLFELLVERGVIDTSGKWIELRTIDDLVNEAVRLLITQPTITHSLLARSLRISHERAQTVFEVMVRRKIIDANGDWEPNAARKADNQYKQGKTTASAPAEDFESKRGNESDDNNRSIENLISEAHKLLRTEQSLSVSLLQEKLGLGFARASFLFQLLVEQKSVDKAGKPTPEMLARLATKDHGAVFGCPFCEKSQVRHYQLPKRLMPDLHFYKCPKCLAEFQPSRGGRYKLVEFPPNLADKASAYRNESYTPAQWNDVVNANKSGK